MLLNSQSWTYNVFFVNTKNPGVGVKFVFFILFIHYLDNVYIFVLFHLYIECKKKN